MLASELVKLLQEQIDDGNDFIVVGLAGEEGELYTIKEIEPSYGDYQTYFASPIITDNIIIIN